MSKDPKFDLNEAHPLASQAVGTVQFFQRHLPVPGATKK